MISNQALESWQASIGIEAQRQPKATLGSDPAPNAGAPLGPSGNTPAGLGMKSILLVDSNLRSRDSRAKILRTFGVHVDCAENAGAALVRLAAEKYNLVLVDPGRDADSAESLVRKIKTNNSRQLVGFLVGSPLFVARSLKGGAHRTHRVPPSAIVALDKSGPEDAGDNLVIAETEEQV